MTSLRSWEELTDPEGRLERPVDLGWWRVPGGIHLQGERLVWEPYPEPPAHRARSGVGLLEGFLELAEAPVEKIEVYARRWGVLEICRHGLPASHHPPPPFPPTPKPVEVTWCRALGRGPFSFDPRRWQEPSAWEPVDAWRRYSRQMRCLLNLAARVKDGKVGRPEDWRGLFCEVHDRPVPWWKQTVASDREGITLQLREWLAIGNVRSHAVLAEKGSGFRLRVGGLFGALGVQLSLVICGTEGFAICAGCGRDYAPRPHPRVSQRRYCPACRGRKIPQRDAAADYRQRVAQRRRLVKEGVSSDNSAK